MSVDLKNTSGSLLVMPSGAQIKPGETVGVIKADADSSGVASMVESGMLAFVEKPKAEAEVKAEVKIKVSNGE